MFAIAGLKLLVSDKTILFLQKLSFFTYYLRLGTFFMSESKEKNKIPFFAEAVAAGFPSPATDFCESRLDLNELCVNNPAATYFVRAQGDSMLGAGIFPNDVLVVDRSLSAKHGDIVIVVLNGELTVKQLETKPALRLVPMNPNYQPVEIPEENDMEIFGVATTVIHSLKNL